MILSIHGQPANSYDVRSIGLILPTSLIWFFTLPSDYHFPLPYPPLFLYYRFTLTCLFVASNFYFTFPAVPTFCLPSRRVGHDCFIRIATPCKFLILPFHANPKCPSFLLTNLHIPSFVRAYVKIPAHRHLPCFVFFLYLWPSMTPPLESSWLNTLNPPDCRNLLFEYPAKLPFHFCN